MKNFLKHQRDLLKHIYKTLIANIETVDTEESLNQISNIEVAASFLEKYSKAKLQGIKEELGVTASFGLNILI